MSQPPFAPRLRPLPALLIALLAPPALAGPAPTAAPESAAAPATPESAPAPAPPALMLAQIYAPGIDLSGYWASEKLDGVRAYWDGARLITRGGHRVHAPEWFTAGFPTEPLDGELWMGRGRFEALSGTVRRREPRARAWREVRYLVFDLPADPGPFGARLARLRVLVAGVGNPSIGLVEQTRVPDHAALMARLAAVVGSGGEGLMLHRDGSPYRGGRSADLLKVKAHQDAEARVIGHVPGKGRFLGMLGALEVQDGQGRRFRIGTGFTDAERRDPPPLGSRVTYRYRGRTEDGVPRFASFLRVDGDWDEAPADRTGGTTAEPAP